MASPNQPHKLSAYKDSQSTRHLDDIASIVRLQRGKLDLKQLDITAASLRRLAVIVGTKSTLVENKKMPDKNLPNCYDLTLFEVAYDRVYNVIYERAYQGLAWAN